MQFLSHTASSPRDGRGLSFAVIAHASLDRRVPLRAIRDRSRDIFHTQDLHHRSDDDCSGAMKSSQFFYDPRKVSEYTVFFVHVALDITIYIVNSYTIRHLVSWVVSTYTDSRGWAQRLSPSRALCTNGSTAAGSPGIATPRRSFTGASGRQCDTCGLATLTIKGGTGAVHSFQPLLPFSPLPGIYAQTFLSMVRSHA